MKSSKKKGDLLTRLTWSQTRSDHGTILVGYDAWVTAFQGFRKWRSELRSHTRPGKQRVFAIENGHRNSEFSHEKWWFSIVVLHVYQRVSGWWCSNHLEKYEFVNGKDDNPYMKWKIKAYKSHVPNHQPDILFDHSWSISIYLASAPWL